MSGNGHNGHNGHNGRQLDRLLDGKDEDDDTGARWTADGGGGGGGGSSSSSSSSSSISSGGGGGGGGDGDQNDAEQAGGGRVVLPEVMSQPDGLTDGRGEDGSDSGKLDLHAKFDVLVFRTDARQQKADGAAAAAAATCTWLCALNWDLSGGGCGGRGAAG